MSALRNKYKEDVFYRSIENSLRRFFTNPSNVRAVYKAKKAEIINSITGNVSSKYIAVIAMGLRRIIDDIDLMRNRDKFICIGRVADYEETLAKGMNAATSAQEQKKADECRSVLNDVNNYKVLTFFLRRKREGGDNLISAYKDVLVDIKMTLERIHKG